MKKRQGYKIVILEPALSRLKRKECPACGKPRKGWTRTQRYTCCSKGCTMEWERLYKIYGWNGIRKKIFKRDKHTCVKCGFKGNYSNLIADHIKPIALGGDEWDFDNIQTLCSKCNKIKTKQDAKEIAKLRRVEKILVAGQVTLPSATFDGQKEHNTNYIGFC